MNSPINFSGNFKKRMWFLAVVTGVIIAISMPVTYFVLAVKESQEEAHIQCEQLAWKIQDLFLENPDLWFFSSWKYLQIFTREQTETIVSLNIYDEKNTLLHEVKVNPPSPFTICETVPLKFNNQLYGYIEITNKTDSIWTISSLLLLGFTMLGGIIAFILFHYPLKIVLSAEQEIKINFEKLEKLSYWDPLTGLPNRIQLNRILQSLMLKTQENQQQFAFIFLDIDGFKLINDNLGHPVGDQLLGAFSRRIHQHLEDDAIFSRVSGDEFAIIIPDSRQKKMDSICESILKSLEDPFVFDVHELYTTASIGVCFYPDDARDIDTLFKLVDLAMYRSKDLGKNRYTFSSLQIQADAHHKLEFEHGLRRALKNGEIIPYYQPIIDAKTGKVSGFEALARWIHPILGLISPNQFIPIAENTGLIIPLGLRIMRLACEDLKKWHDLGYPVSVSVNISAKQFLQNNLLAYMDGIIESTGINPSFLQIEITESFAFEVEEILTIFEALHQKGVQIVIDDFGTGYSSLKQLKSCFIDALKIDQMFIHSIPKDENNTTMVSFILDLAHKLHIRTVAEGVETAEQVDFLEKNDCHELQGYYFSKPLAYGEITQWLKK